MTTCAHIRESLPVRCLVIKYLKECFILEVCINNNEGYLNYCTGRSPSQITDQFDIFMLNLEKLLVDISNCNPHFLPTFSLVISMQKPKICQLMTQQLQNDLI